MPGETATFANYISYDKGINGISLYLYNLAEDPTLANWTDFFEFRVGNDNTFVSPGWASAPNPIGIEIDRLDNVDRVNIRWADNSIVNEWLEVKTLANEFTGLTFPDVHYWGSAIGDTGDSATDALVDADDISRVRNNLSGFFSVDADSPYDINRDRFVNATDIGIIRNNLSGFFGLTLISPPAGGGSNIFAGRGNLTGSGFDERMALNQSFDSRSGYCLASQKAERSIKVKELKGSIKSSLIQGPLAERDQFFAVSKESQQPSVLDGKRRTAISAAANPLAKQIEITTLR